MLTMIAMMLQEHQPLTRWVALIKTEMGTATRVMPFHPMLENGTIQTVMA